MIQLLDYAITIGMDPMTYVSGFVDDAYKLLSNIYHTRLETYWEAFQCVFLFINIPGWVGYTVLVAFVLTVATKAEELRRKDEQKRDSFVQKKVTGDLDALSKELERLSKDIADIKHHMKQTEHYVSNIYDRLLKVEIIDY